MRNNVSRAMMDMRNKINQQGFSLLEVMVAFFILGIGLLGLAGLQTVGLKNNHSSQLRTFATVAAYDITERMRANPMAVAQKNYNNVQGVVKTACLSEIGCAAAEMASHDLWEWQSSVADFMPSGSATVCIDSTPDDGDSGAAACDGIGQIYAIKTWWDEDKEGAANQRYVVTFNP